MQVYHLSVFEYTKRKDWMMGRHSEHSPRMLASCAHEICWSTHSLGFSSAMVPSVAVEDSGQSRLCPAEANWAKKNKGPPPRIEKNKELEVMLGFRMDDQLKHRVSYVRSKCAIM